MFSFCVRQVARSVRPSLAVRAAWGAHVTQSSLHVSPLHTCTRVLCKTKTPTRANSTASSRLQSQGLPVPISDADLHALLTRASQVWPAPPTVPPGWSSTWSTWPYLLTFYYPSSYYLMLPQIDMLLNIRYRLPGEARPVLFSTQADQEQWVFTLVDAPTRFFLCDVPSGVVKEFVGVHTVEDLVSSMESDWEALEKGARALVPDEEGEECLKRIMERDSGVIPVLAERFLGYVPEETRECDENPELWDERLESGEDAMAAMMGLMADMEASPSFQEVRRLLEEEGELEKEETKEAS